jgi:hypothetical protein
MALNKNLTIFLLAVFINLYALDMIHYTSTYPILKTRMGVNSNWLKRWVRNLYAEGESYGSVQGCDNLG